MKIIVLKLKTNIINIERDVSAFNKYFLTARVSIVVLSKFHTLLHTANILHAAYLL